MMNMSDQEITYLSYVSRPDPKYVCSLRYSSLPEHSALAFASMDFEPKPQSVVAVGFTLRFGGLSQCLVDLEAAKPGSLLVISSCSIWYS